VMAWASTAEGASTATVHTNAIFASARISHPPSLNGHEPTVTKLESGNRL
jgi:hypothetical protein